MDVMNVLPIPNPGCTTSQPKVQSVVEAGKDGQSNDIFTTVLNTVVEQPAGTDVIKVVPENLLVNNLAAMLAAATANTGQQNADTAALKKTSEADLENSINPQLLAAVMALLGAQVPNIAQNGVQNSTADNGKASDSGIAATLNTPNCQVPFAVLQGKVLSAMQSMQDSKDGLNMTEQLLGQNMQQVALSPAADTSGQAQEKTEMNPVALQNLKLESGQVLNMPQVAAAQAENTADMGAAKVQFAGIPDKMGQSGSQGKQAEKLLATDTQKVSADTPLFSAEHTLAEMGQQVDAVQAVPVSIQADSNSIGQLLQPKTTEEQDQEDAAGTDNQPAFSNILAQHTDKVVRSSVHSAQPQAKSGVTDFHNVAGQIVEHARLFKQPFDQNNSEMLIKLRPEHLGELSLKVAVENGVVTASFHSNNAEVRSIIEASLPQLKQDLADQGLKVDNVDVYAGMSDFFSDSQQGELFRQQQQQSAKLRNLSVNEDYLEAVEDTAVPQVAGADGVDYRV